MFERTKKKCMRCCAPDTRQGTISTTSSEQGPTTRPEPHLYASRNSVCAGIVARAVLFSEGGGDAFSKTPTASNPVIYFRVELHLGAEATRHSGADSRCYQQHLGVSFTPSSYEDSVCQQEAGPTVFDPQPRDERPFQGDPNALDVELSNPGSRQNGSPATSRWNRGRD